MPKKTVLDSVNDAISQKEDKDRKAAEKKAARLAREKELAANEVKLGQDVPKTLAQTHRKLNRYFTALAKETGLDFKYEREAPKTVEAEYKYVLSSPAVPPLEFYLVADTDAEAGTFEQKLGVLNNERAEYVKSKLEGWRSEDKLEKEWPLCNTNHTSWERHSSGGSDWDVNAAIVFQTPVTNEFVNGHLAQWFSAVAKKDDAFRTKIKNGTEIKDAGFFTDEAALNGAEVKTSKRPGPKIGRNGIAGAWD